MRPKQTKRQKKRTKWLSSATRWRRIGEEQEYGDIFLTRISRKPPAFKVEAVTDTGDVFHCALQKAAPGTKGWDVIIPQSNEKGEAGVRTIPARTKRDALKFISTMQVVEHDKGSPDQEEAADDEA